MVKSTSNSYGKVRGQGLKSTLAPFRRQNDSMLAKLGRENGLKSTLAPFPTNTVLDRPLKFGKRD